MGGNIMCKCGHTAFYHGFGYLRKCCASACDCAGFDMIHAPAPSPTAPPPDAAERRRYTLGMMAAHLRAACGSVGHSGSISASGLWSREGAVEEAVQLLALIERREKDRVGE